MTDETVLVDELPPSDDELELVRAALAEEYEVLEELGRGGMAVMYRARELSLDREVALKVLPLARTFDHELVERFQREAKLSAALEHPRIIPIYRVGQIGRVSFFTMKYVRGASLAETLDAGEALPPEAVERLLLQVGDGLEHAHRHGVIHRDLKPDNIMTDPQTGYVIMDFGIAKSIGGAQLTQTGGSIGTPKYMSPEQGQGLELDGRSDFYSLGVVAYHALTGRPPFERADALSTLYAHVHDPVPEPDLASAEHRRLWGAIRLLLSKDPAERPNDASSLQTAMEPAGSTSPSATATVPASPLPLSVSSVTDKAARWARSRSRTFWGASTLILLLIFALSRSGARTACREALKGTGENGRGVLVEPLGSIEQGAAIELAFIACGVPDGTRFRTEVSVRTAGGGGVIGGVQRLFGGDRSEARQSWDDESDGLATSREREIDPGALEPGAYRLTVKVEDADGREAEASHDFTIVEPS